MFSTRKCQLRPAQTALDAKAFAQLTETAKRLESFIQSRLIGEKVPMSFNSGEQVMWSGRPVFWHMAASAIVSFGLFGALGLFIAVMNGVDAGDAVLILVAAIATAFVYQFVKWSRTECSVTSERIRLNSGVVFGSCHEMRISEIARVAVRGKLPFGSAIITFNSTGGEWVCFGRVKDHEKIKQLIYGVQRHK